MDVIKTWLEDSSTWGDILGNWDFSMELPKTFEAMSSFVKNTGEGGFAAAFEGLSSAFEALKTPAQES